MNSEEMKLFWRDIHAGDIDEVFLRLAETGFNVHDDFDGDSILKCALRRGVFGFIDRFVSDKLLSKLTGDELSFLFYWTEMWSETAIEERNFAAYDEFAFQVIKLLDKHGLLDIDVRINGKYLLDVTAEYTPEYHEMIAYLDDIKAPFEVDATAQAISDARTVVGSRRDAYKALSKNERAHEDLWIAISVGSLYDTKLALTCLADVNGIGDEIPLNLAMSCNNVAIFDFLLNHPELDIDKTDVIGRGFLQTCILTRNRYASIRFFMSLFGKGKRDGGSDRDGNTPLIQAVKAADFYVVSFICERIPELFTPFHENAAGESALSICEARKHEKGYLAMLHLLEWRICINDANQRIKWYPDNLICDQWEWLEHEMLSKSFSVEHTDRGLPSKIHAVGGVAKASRRRENGDMVEVYSREELVKLSRADEDYEKLISSLPSGDMGFRRLGRVGSEFHDRIEELKRDFPNMTPFIEYVEKNAILRELKGNSPMYFPPVLLVSKPGVGKTACVASIAKLLSLPFNLVDFSTSTANWVMTGSSSQWKDAKPGKIFNACIKGDVANPLFLCDEIDKSGGDHRYPVVNVFHTLLEREMAQEFADEYYQDLKFDASHIMYVATANDIHAIPEPVLSRFHVIEVQPPSREQMPAVISSVYRSIRDFERHDIFPDVLADDVVSSLIVATPREAKAKLNLAFANAAYRIKKGRVEQVEITQDDLEAAKVKRKGIGFVLDAKH